MVRSRRPRFFFFPFLFFLFKEIKVRSVNKPAGAFGVENDIFLHQNESSCWHGENSTSCTFRSGEKNLRSNVRTLERRFEPVF